MRTAASGKLAAILGHTPQEQTILQDGLHERAVGLDTLAGQSIPSETLIATFERVLTQSGA